MVSNSVFKEPINSPPGSWVLYIYDGNAQAQSIHENLIDAVRAQLMGSSICWWPYGMPLNEAIEAWQKE